MLHGRHGACRSQGGLYGSIPGVGRAKDGHRQPQSLQIPRAETQLGMLSLVIEAENDQHGKTAVRGGGCGTT